VSIFIEMMLTTHNYRFNVTHKVKTNKKCSGKKLVQKIYCNGKVINMDMFPGEITAQSPKYTKFNRNGYKIHIQPPPSI